MDDKGNSFSNGPAGSTLAMKQMRDSGVSWGRVNRWDMAEGKPAE